MISDITITGNAAVVTGAIMIMSVLEKVSLVHGIRQSSLEQRGLKKILLGKQRL